MRTTIKILSLLITLQFASTSLAMDDFESFENEIQSYTEEGELQTSTSQQFEFVEGAKDVTPVFPKEVLEDEIAGEGIEHPELGPDYKKTHPMVRPKIDNRTKRTASLDHLPEFQIRMRAATKKSENSDKLN